MAEIGMALCLAFFVAFPGLMFWATQKDKEVAHAKSLFMSACLQKDRAEQCEAIWEYSSKRTDAAEDEGRKK